MINLQTQLTEIKLILKKPELTEHDKREVIMWFIFFCTTIYVVEVKTAVITDVVNFERHFNTAKNYFLSFIQ